MRIVACISVRNRPDWLAECVGSVVAAGISDVHVYDDASDAPMVDSRVRMRRGETRLGSYAARAALLDELGADSTRLDETVVVLVDGDDRLKSGVNLLGTLERTFADPGVQVASFGRQSMSFIEAMSDLRTGHLGRDGVWLKGVVNLLPNHLRAFRLGAYRRLRRRDPGHLLGRHADGSFVRKSTDRALLAPMIISEGYSAFRAVPLAVYNYRIYRGMTHHDKANRANAEIFPSLLTKLLPPHP